VTIHRGTKADSATVVGDDCYLMSGAHMGHNSVIGSGVVIANNCLLAGYVEIQDRVVLGGGTVFHQFMRIGRMAMVRGGTRFGKDIPPFSMGDEDNILAAQRDFAGGAARACACLQAHFPKWPECRPGTGKGARGELGLRSERVLRFHPRIQTGSLPVPSKARRRRGRLTDLAMPGDPLRHRPRACTCKNLKPRFLFAVP